MKRFARIYMILAVSLVTLYLCLFAFGLLVGKRLVFPMPASSYSQPAADWVRIAYSVSDDSAHEQTNAREREQVAATVKEQAEAAVNEQAGATSYVLANVREVPQPKGYILYQHGNGEDLGMIAPRLQVLNDLGWSVLAWEYPGYGLSPGIANETSVNAAMHAVAAYAKDTLDWPVEQTVLYGRSVGGGPSILLATEAPYRGLITEGTFTSAFRVVTRIKLLPIDVFDNWSRIDKIDMPSLFLHGNRDFIVPFSHGKKLYASAKEPKYHSWFKGGGHNNLVEDFTEQYTQAVRAFLDNLPEPTAAENSEHTE